MEKDFDRLVAEDPLLRARLSPDRKGSAFNAQRVLENLDEDSGTLNLMFLGASVITKGLRDFLPQGNEQEVISFIRDTYGNLGKEKKAAVSARFMVRR